MVSSEWDGDGDGESQIHGAYLMESEMDRPQIDGTWSPGCKVKSQRETQVSTAFP